MLLLLEDVSGASRLHSLNLKRSARSNPDTVEERLQILPMMKSVLDTLAIHDPTQLNQQGPDIGSQYRSAIFYHNPAQKSAAESYVNSLTEQNSYDNPIVTEISELSIFYEAEEYHHDYFSKNPSNPYCIFNTLPKMIKAREIFSDMSSPGD